MIKEKSFSVSKNLQAVDMIKAEILSEVSHLYQTMAYYDETESYDSVENSIATIIAMDYILARRLGLSFSAVDEKIRDLAEMAAENGHELEKSFGDMSELSRHIKKR